MSIKLRTPSNGSVTLSPQDTASDVVLTVPAVTGTVNTSGVVNEVPAGSASAPAMYPTGDTNTGIFFPAADTIAFAEGGVEAARIDSSGNLLVGTTSPSLSGKMTLAFAGGSPSSRGYVAKSSSTAGTAVFVSENPNGIVGEIISVNSSTSYVTTSDYRLKEKVQPMQNALAAVAQLKPCTYTWKADGSAGQGFIAHELQAVVPDCVTGEKDAVDADGNPQYQGVDTSFLVATLTAAIQEQQAMITQLQSRIEALENA